VIRVYDESGNVIETHEPAGQFASVRFPLPSRLQNAVIRVYGADGNVIETHEHKGDFKECL
jgi:hypothetical protein